MAGYDLFRKDRPCNLRGGGVLLYVARSLGAIEYATETKFPEQVWYKIPGKGVADIFIGVFCRTLTESVFGSGLHQLTKDVLDEMSGKHILLMGDFNYGGINWDQGQAGHACSTEGVLFLECVENNLLTQHVVVPT